MSRRPACRSPIPMLSMVAALLVAGCSDDPVEAPTVENFARSWQLTACVYRSEANSATNIDLVAAGWIIALHVNDNGRLRYLWTPPGGAETYWDGAWAVDGNTLLVTRDGNTFAWEFDARVQEETMALSGAHAEYDFDDDGTPEAALWSLNGTNN